MQAAIVTVGDEILAGSTVNTNASWICEQLHDNGVQVARITTVPDRIADIARVVNEYQAAYDAVIVTGGLGPTHDDVTMEGVGAAVGRSIEPHTEALTWLEETGGYKASERNEQAAQLPAGAQLLKNEVGVAPGAIVDRIYVLPGVPTEMKAMFEQISDAFVGTETVTETVTIDEPESTLVDRLNDVQSKFDVSVGSYPGHYVRVKLTGEDPAVVRDAKAWLKAQSNVVPDEQTE
ncbi:competence/damage-inducible protein A [Halorubraceae archaeon YAN]|nr:competence/damage-inducible protein A [Halorubraceae archaeon YAN]